MKPSVGRIVHVRQRDGRCLPAIVTQVRPDRGDMVDVVDLVILNAHWGSAVSGQVGVEGGGDWGMWHWPEKVEEDVVVPKAPKTHIVVHAEEGSK